jgi:hypothetical protein
MLYTKLQKKVKSQGQGKSPFFSRTDPRGVITPEKIEIIFADILKHSEQESKNGDD